MRIFIKLLIIFAILPTTLIGQNKETKLLPFKDGEIVTKKTGNFSSVEMRPSFIEESEGGKHNLYFIAMFIRSDKYPTKVPLITITFYSNSPKCKFPEPSAVGIDIKSEVVIDEKLFAMSNDLDKEKMSKNGGSFANYNELESDVCNGMVTMIMLRKNFLNFLNAKKASIKIGEYQFELKPHNVKALGNMAKLLIPPK